MLSSKRNLRTEFDVKPNLKNLKMLFWLQEQFEFSKNLTKMEAVSLTAVSWGKIQSLLHRFFYELIDEKGGYDYKPHY